MFTLFGWFLSCHFIFVDELQACSKACDASPKGKYLRMQSEVSWTVIISVSWAGLWWIFYAPTPTSLLSKRCGFKMTNRWKFWKRQTLIWKKNAQINETNYQVNLITWLSEWAGMVLDDEKCTPYLRNHQKSSSSLTPWLQFTLHETWMRLLWYEWAFWLWSLLGSHVCRLTLPVPDVSWCFLIL